MSAQLMLAPRVDGTKRIAKVVILATADDGRTVKVLDVGVLEKESRLLKQFVSSYSAAARLWDSLAGLILLAGIVLSSIWHWWAFTLGLILSGVVERANRASISDFALAALASHPEAKAAFAGRGLVWVMDRSRLVPA